MEIVREIYAYERDLTDGSGGRIAPDAEFDFSAVYFDSPVLKGIDELRRFRDSGPWAGSPIHFEPERFFDVDDERVLVFVRVSATGAGSGVQIANRVAHVLTLRDRRVVRFRVFGDRQEALEAVGLSKQAAPRTNPENLELARAYFEEIARASREEFDPETMISRMAEFWDPEIEWDTRGGPVEDLAGVYRGIEGGSQWCREWFEAWQALRFEYEVVDAGERVVVTLPDLRLRGRSSGIEVAMGRHAWVITFRDGLMVHQKLYTSQAAALEAVGLSEQDAHAES